MAPHSDSPAPPRALSGRLIVIVMVTAGIAATLGIYFYWNAQTFPFRPLREAIGRDILHSRPQVEGGRHKGGALTLRVAMSVNFNPDDDVARVDRLTRRVVTLARKYTPLNDYEQLEIHLIYFAPENSALEKSIRLSREEFQTIPDTSSADPRDAAPVKSRTPATAESPEDHVLDAPSAAALPPSADQQIQALQAELAAANPGYQAEQAQIVVEAGQVRAAEFVNQPLKNLGPLRSLQLQYLSLRDCPVGDLTPLAGQPLQEAYLEGTAVTDLTPLKGAPLRTLWLNGSPVSDLGPLAESSVAYLNLLGTKVRDLAPLAKLPLDTLWLNETRVEDLSPLEGVRLVSLTLHQTPVRDLSPLSRMATLQRLHLGETDVSDLTPLKDLRLQRLIFTPSRIQAGLEGIREMASLTELDTEFREPQRLSPAEFWQKFDAGEFAKAE